MKKKKAFFLRKKKRVTNPQAAPTLPDAAGTQSLDGTQAQSTNRGQSPSSSVPEARAEERVRRSISEKEQILARIDAGESPESIGFTKQRIYNWRFEVKRAREGGKAKPGRQEAGKLPAPMKPKNDAPLVPATPAKARSAQVLLKKAGRPPKELPVISGPEAAAIHNEIVFYLNRSAARLVAGIRSGRIGVRELTQGYTVDMLTALNAAQGGV